MPPLLSHKCPRVHVRPLLAENQCTPLADAPAWAAVGCVVAGTQTGATVTNLGAQSAATGYTSCVITCPTNGDAFTVTAVPNENCGNADTCPNGYIADSAAAATLCASTACDRADADLDACCTGLYMYQSPSRRPPARLLARILTHPPACRLTHPLAFTHWLIQSIKT